MYAQQIMNGYIATAGYVLDKNGNMIASTDQKRLALDETQGLLDLASHKTIGFLKLFGD